MQLFHFLVQPKVALKCMKIKLVRGSLEFGNSIGNKGQLPENYHSSFSKYSGLSGFRMKSCKASAGKLCIDAEIAVILRKKNLEKLQIF